MQVKSVAAFLSAFVAGLALGKDVDVLCIYYPEWHVYPEGEAIFGKGRTEWDYVDTAVPRFEGHEQPIRLVDGHPDDSDPKDVAKEIDYAADAGIDVFLYDWYWADGHPIQHEALERGFMKAPNRGRMKFAIMWANHDRSDAFRPEIGKSGAKWWWRLKWTGEEFLEVIDYCIRHYFPCPEHYRTKDGRLFFSVYSAKRLIDECGGVKKFRAFLDEAQRRVKAAGLPPVHFSAMVRGPWEVQAVTDAGYDSTSSYNMTPYNFDENKVANVPTEGRQVFTHEEYARLHVPFNESIREKSKLPHIPVVVRGWDPSPRCRLDEPFPWKKLSYPYLGIITDTRPELFGRCVADLMKMAREDPKKPGMLLVNAWNEYTEGSYLMPDAKNGDAYLRALKSALAVPPVEIVDAWTETSVRKGMLDVKAEVFARAPQANCTVACRIRDADGRDVFTLASKADLAAGTNTVSLSRPWADPHLWDVGDGYCYTADVRVRAPESSALPAALKFPFGFREVWTEGRQAMLNGRPLRLRIEMGWFGLDEKSLPWFRRLGLNAYYLQANWYWLFRNGKVVTDIERTRGSLLSLCDREGIVFLCPAWLANGMVGRWGDAEAAADYEAKCRQVMRRLRRHPSIVAWCVSMNAFNPKDAISPAGLGVARTPEWYGKTMGSGWDVKARNVQRACEVAKAIDPTRLAYGHGEGGVGGDFATANCYPNLTPAQEVEDYPEVWSEKGNRPFFACEYGTYAGSYFKDIHRCLLTEYDAIYEGYRAYREETDAFRERLVETGRTNTFHGKAVWDIAPLSPAFDRLEDLYQGATARGWRGYGMLGWHQFHGARYGTPANPTVNAVCQFKYMQPHLEFIGDAKAHTGKTHSYVAGEKVEKALWKVDDPGGQVTSEPLVLTAPAVTKKEHRTLKKNAESFDYTVYPALPTCPELSRRVYLYDPKGESSWVKKMVRTRPVTERAGGYGEAILVVGRNAVGPDAPMPFTAADVQAGLRVVYLEQQPSAWGLFGLGNVDVFARRAFFACERSAGALRTLYDGLDEADLANWRGRPTLVPEYRYTRNQAAQAPKGGGRHAIASTVLEIPDAPGYRPLFVCEFDLSYAPLLEWSFGAGAVVYSTFDFTGRVGTDPSATQVAVNLFRYLDRPKAPPANARLHVALDAAQLVARGIRAEMREASAVAPAGELGSVVGANLLRWRDRIRYAAIVEPGAECGGLWYRKGDDVYLQVGPSLLENRYSAATQRIERIAIGTSVARLHQLVGRVRTALGETADPRTAAFAAVACAGGGMEDVPRWNVLGPFDRQPGFAVRGIDFEGQRAAIRGDLNPNVDYTLKGKGAGQDVTRNFRPQVAPDACGVVDLTHLLYPDGVRPEKAKTYFCYAVGEYESAADREAILAVDVNGVGELWVNGELTLDLWDPSFRPQTAKSLSGGSGQMRFRIRLRKGKNVFAFKLMPPPVVGEPILLAVKVSRPGFALSAPFGRVNDGAVGIYNADWRFGGAYGYHYW